MFQKIVFLTGGDLSGKMEIKRAGVGRVQSTLDKPVA